MRFIDLDLARRVEMAEANAGRECAEACHGLHPDYPVAAARNRRRHRRFRGSGFTGDASDRSRSARCGQRLRT